MSNELVRDHKGKPPSYIRGGIDEYFPGVIWMDEKINDNPRTIKKIIIDLESDKKLEYIM